LQVWQLQSAKLKRWKVNRHLRFFLYFLQTYLFQRTVHASSTARAARAGGPPARAILRTYFARSTRDRLSVTADRTVAPTACGSDRPHTHQLHLRRTTSTAEEPKDEVDPAARARAGAV
jgi:hypothetical protein